MSRSYTSSPPSASMACGGTALLFTFTTTVDVFSEQHDFAFATPWSRILLEKLTVCSASREIPRLVWNQSVNYRVRKSPSPVFKSSDKSRFIV
jgi:hypothetical protein